LLLQVHTYDVHSRFGHLRAPTSKLARLQLAALHAATASLLPEPSSQATGAETAMQLLRESWSTQPLSFEEQQQLMSIGKLAGYLAPGLRPLVHDVMASSMLLQHLYADNSSSKAGASSTGTAAAAAGSEAAALDADAATACLLHAGRVLPGGFGLNPRQQLSATEQQWLLHTASTPSSSSSNSSSNATSWRRFGLFSPIQQLPKFPVEAEFVQNSEQRLLQLVVTPQQPKQQTEVPKYPLTFNEDLPLEKDMHKELQHSWQCYHSHPEPTEVVPGAKEAIQKLQVTVLGAPFSHCLAVLQYQDLN
jgi:hypothetical protein